MAPCKIKELIVVCQYLRQINQLIGFAPLLSVFNIQGVGGGGLTLSPSSSPNGRGEQIQSDRSHWRRYYLLKQIKASRLRVFRSLDLDHHIKPKWSATDHHGSSSHGVLLMGERYVHRGDETSADYSKSATPTSRSGYHKIRQLDENEGDKMPRGLELKSRLLFCHS